MGCESERIAEKNRGGSVWKPVESEAAAKVCGVFIGGSLPSGFGNTMV
jgi:hypothetical protein